MKTRQILNILVILLVLVVNFLANALPLNGQGTGEISDRFPVLFTPAGYVFAIWGVIYLGLIAFAVFQALPAQKDNPRIIAASPWFIASSLLNTAWIFMWHYNLLALSLLVMLGLLATLIMTYLKLEIGRAKPPRGEYLTTHVTFGIYLGWISVATVANVTTVLYNLGWRGAPLPEAAWSVVVLAVATALGLLMIRQRGEVAYPLVLVWAFGGIVVKHAAVAPVAITAGLGVVVVALGLLLLPRMGKRPAATR